MKKRRNPAKKMDVLTAWDIWQKYLQRPRRPGRRKKADVEKLEKAKKVLRGGRKSGDFSDTVARLAKKAPPGWRKIWVVGAGKWRVSEHATEKAAKQAADAYNKYRRTERMGHGAVAKVHPQLRRSRTSGFLRRVKKVKKSPKRLKTVRRRNPTMTTTGRVIWPRRKRSR